MELNPKMQPIFDCLREMLPCTQGGITELKETGKFQIYHLTIKYYFNSKGQTRFKIKRQDTRDGFTYKTKQLSFKPEGITEDNVKAFKKNLSKFIKKYALYELED